jgi:hypothetical protein
MATYSLHLLAIAAIKTKKYSYKDLAVNLPNKKKKRLKRLENG